jgi:uncharacterized protein YhfF
MKNQVKELIEIASKIQENLSEILNWQTADKLELSDEIENLILTYQKQAKKHKIK